MTDKEYLEKWFAEYRDKLTREAIVKLWNRAQDSEREACANMLNLTRSEALLMAGEMSAQEWRTVSAVLVVLQKRMRGNVEVSGE